MAGGLTAIYDHVISAGPFLERTEAYSFSLILISGALGGLFSSFTALPFMLFVLRPKLRRFPFWVSILLNALFIVLLIYVIYLIVVVTIVTSTLQTVPWDTEAISEIGGALRSAQLLQIIMIWFFITSTTFFMIEVNDKYGQGVLKDILLGRYHRPKQEFRIFMFLDIKSSTTIAEKLGDLRYFDFLNEFFHDVTDPIIDSYGRIYQYVGDEIVLSWPYDKGLRNNNSINCFYEMKRIIASLENKYLSKYGICPEFKAGMHGGNVIHTQIGEMKKAVVYIGDVLNTTARIQESCNRLGQEFLISGKLVREFNMSDRYASDFMEITVPRGKKASLQLYSLRQTG